MNKKLITMLTAFCLVFTSTFGSASAVAYGSTTKSEEITAPTAPAVQTEEGDYIKDPETGYIYAKEEREVPTSKTAMANSEGRNKAVLPSLYPAGDVWEVISKYPSTRKQSPYGTCWAHAAVACGEFDLIKNHGYAKTLDLSELQLAYFNYHTANDKLGNLDQDQTYIPSGAENFLDVGGSGSHALMTLAQWKGLTYESNLPYSNAANALNYGVSSSLAYKNDVAKLENAYVIDIKKNPTAVKTAIQTYGAVHASYYHDSQYYDDKSGYALYNCSNGNLGTNHDIAIVGWNDNLPASAFPSWNRPSRNGGWLIRNSWTTNTDGSEYSYFWMSYEDKSLASNVYALDFVPGTKYANIYQHDGTIINSSVGVEKAANVFTAKNPDGAGSEVLQAVMVAFMSNADVQYQVDIYTGLSGGTTTNPETGYHHVYATTTGTTTHAGVHTIYLRQPVYLSPGEKYAIVVTSKSGTVWFGCEQTKNVTYQENGSTISWFNSVAAADPGESLYKASASNGSWSDAATDGLSDRGNLRIKGLTNNSSAKKYAITYQLNGGTNGSANPHFFLSTQSGSTALQNPTRSGYHFLGWYADSACTQRVNAVNYNTKANQTFYAKWCSDSNSTKTSVLSRATLTSDGSYRQTCSGCGKDKGTYTAYSVNSIKLSATKLTYTGKNVNPSPVVKDSLGNKLVKGKDYTCKYSKSTRKNVGRYYVTIVFDASRYDIPNKKLYYTVVPKAPSSGSAKLYGYDDVKVSWSKCTGASGYYVYYKKSTASKYSSYKRTTKTSIKFSNLSDNVKYNFKIVPYYKSGDTRYKSVKTKVVSATTLKKLAQPSISKLSNNRVSLEWECISGASGYQVYWSASKNGKYASLCDYSKDYIGVSFDSPRGKTYWYKTRAYKIVDGKRIYGPWSTPKKFAV